MSIKISVESWMPDYASAIGEVDFDPSEVKVNLEIERKATDWAPISPDGTTGREGTVYFVDGVRRIEAMVWLEKEGSPPTRGVCASIAAGVVKASDHAHVVDVQLRRGIYSSVNPPDLSTRAGVFKPIAVTSGDFKDLNVAIQESLGSLEIEVAAELNIEEDAIVIVDGPLSGHKNVPGGLGFIKTHRVAYLPEPQSKILAKLTEGQRTPIFLTSSTWTRFSWYLRLPGPVVHPYSGLVRLEATGELPSVQQLANRSSKMLPFYASLPHKDPRAPQNLFPIGGLERELRRRLGDREIVHRALKVATMN
ncbi:MAG: hypothetical protein JNN04_12010 [Cyclobacteriaceae bacterium]|nr:hypothetical protein [Cyclobacteriaceae bacterium]